MPLYRTELSAGQAEQGRSYEVALLSGTVSGLQPLTEGQPGLNLLQLLLKGTKNL